MSGVDFSRALKALEAVRRDGEKPRALFCAAVFEAGDGLFVTHEVSTATVDDMIAVARAIIFNARASILKNADPDCENCQDNAEDLLFALAALGDEKAAEEVDALEAAEAAAEPPAKAVVH